MLPPPVSSLQVARNHRPLRSAAQPWGIQVATIRVSPLVCEWPEHACISFKIHFCLTNPLGSYMWKLNGVQNLISKCVVFDIHYCAVGHIGRKPLAMCSEEGLIAFASTTYISSFFGATESTVFVVSAKDTNIFSYEAIPLGNLQSIQHIS